MKAMIFAAGLGTRLRPFTFHKPKALVEVNNIPLLEICIRNLIRNNFTNIVINVHHFADEILQFLASKKNFNINISISDEREMLLETGGGLKKARSLLGDVPFLVHNVDILSDINLQKLYQQHLKTSAIASLAVMKRTSSRYLYFTEKNELMGWINTKTKEEIITRNSHISSKMAFTGIHIISPEIFNHIERKGNFSIIPEYLNISKTENILGVDCSNNKWIDVGRPENLKKATEIFTSSYNV